MRDEGERKNGTGKTTRLYSFPSYVAWLKTSNQPEGPNVPKGDRRDESPMSHKENVPQRKEWL
jgi:hypothetical protein